MAGDFTTPRPAGADRAARPQHRGGARARPAEDRHAARQLRPRLHLPEHAPPAPSATSTTTTTSATTFYRLFLDDVARRTRARSSSTPARASPTRSRPSTGASATGSALGAGRPRARDRLRLGRLRAARRARARLPRHRRHHLARAARRGAPRACAAAGLADRVAIEYRDYRDVAGTFTHVVSIEMLEAVGECAVRAYFATVDRVLAPGGRRAACRRSRCPSSATTRTAGRATASRRTSSPAGIPSLEAMARRDAALVAAARAGARGDRPALRRRRCGRGARRSTRASTRCARSATTSASCAPGTTTWRSARRGSASASCATSRSCSPGPAGRRLRQTPAPCWTLAIETLEPAELRGAAGGAAAAAVGVRPRAAPTFYRDRLPEQHLARRAAGRWLHRQGGAAREPGGGAARSATTWRADADDVIRLHRTSGMSGSGMNLGYTARDARRHRRASARAACAPPGCVRTDRVVHCLNYQLWTGGVTDHLILEAAGATVVPFGVGNTRALVDVIRDLGVNAISCTPSYPALLAKVLREETDLRAARPRPAARPVRRRGRARQRRLPARPRGDLGLRGAQRQLRPVRGAVDPRLQCEETTDLHFHAGDVVFAEIIDPATLERLPIARGHDAASWCARTSPASASRSSATATRDTVTVTGTGPCACGRTAWRFRIAGRTDDMFNVRGVNVFPTAVRRGRGGAAGAALRAPADRPRAGRGRTTASSCAPRPPRRCRRRGSPRRRPRSTSS